MKPFTPALVLLGLIVSIAVFAQNQSPATASADTKLGATATTQPAQAQARPRFVPVLISATDSSGSPLLGLTKEQLTIVDTNQPAQPLQMFNAADVPLHLGVILVANPATFSQQQAAAIALVNQVIRPKIDEAFVVTARGKSPWPGDHLEWKQDPAELTQIIKGLDRNTGIADAFNFSMDTEETGFDENAGRLTIQSYGAGSVNIFDVAYTMMASDPRMARRVLVFFREPMAHSQGYGRRVNGAVEGQLLRVIAAAQEMHITTFVIGLEDTKLNGVSDQNIGKSYISLHAGDEGGAGSANRAYDTEMARERTRAYENGKSNIQRLAAQTGGASFWSVKKNYPDAVANIANLIKGQYLLVFTPSDVPGPVHTLKISAANGGNVLTQTSFFYGTPAK